MADVPGEGGEGPALGVHDGVLDDVGRARHVGGEVLLSPAGRPVGLGQQPPGNESVIWGDLPEEDILSEDMLTAKGRRAEARLEHLS